MRLGIISDIHGNYVALRAVLESLRSCDVDEIINLGDLIANGAQPRLVLDALKPLPIATILGNTDQLLLDLAASPPPLFQSERQRQVYDVDRWTEGQLSYDDKKYLRSLKRFSSVIYGSTRIVFYHGSPNDFNDIILSTTDDDQVMKKFDAIWGDVLVGGHTHVQMVRVCKDALIVNPGSVGLPYYISRDGVHVTPPWSEYAIIEIIPDGITVTLKRVTLEVAEVVTAIRTSGIPHSEIWANEWAHGGKNVSNAFR